MINYFNTNASRIIVQLLMVAFEYSMGIKRCRDVAVYGKSKN